MPPAPIPDVGKEEPGSASGPHTRLLRCSLTRPCLAGSHPGFTVCEGRWEDGERRGLSPEAGQTATRSRGSCAQRSAGRGRLGAGADALQACAATAAFFLERRVASSSGSGQGLAGSPWGSGPLFLLELNSEAPPQPLLCGFCRHPPAPRSHESTFWLREFACSGRFIEVESLVM